MPDTARSEPEDQADDRSDPDLETSDHGRPPQRMRVTVAMPVARRSPRPRSTARRESRKTRNPVTAGAAGAHPCPELDQKSGRHEEKQRAMITAVGEAAYSKRFCADEHYSWATTPRAPIGNARAQGSVFSLSGSRASCSSTRSSHPRKAQGGACGSIPQCWIPSFARTPDHDVVSRCAGGGGTWLGQRHWRFRATSCSAAASAGHCATGPRMVLGRCATHPPPGRCGAGQSRKSDHNRQPAPKLEDVHLPGRSGGYPDPGLRRRALRLPGEQPHAGLR